MLEGDAELVQRRKLVQNFCACVLVSSRDTVICIVNHHTRERLRE